MGNPGSGNGGGWNRGTNDDPLTLRYDRESWNRKCSRQPVDPNFTPVTRCMPPLPNGLFPPAFLGYSSRMMVDIHCHILAGLDDGASSLEESLEMAEMAVADGTTSPRSHPAFQWRIPVRSPARTGTARRVAECVARKAGQPSHPGHRVRLSTSATKISRTSRRTSPSTPSIKKIICWWNSRTSPFRPAPTRRCTSFICWAFAGHHASRAQPLASRAARTLAPLASSGLLRANYRAIVAGEMGQGNAEAGRGMAGRRHRSFLRQRRAQRHVAAAKTCRSPPRGRAASRRGCRQGFIRGKSVGGVRGARAAVRAATTRRCGPCTWRGPP